MARSKQTHRTPARAPRAAPDDREAAQTQAAPARLHERTLLSRIRVDAEIYSDSTYLGAHPEVVLFPEPPLAMQQDITDESIHWWDADGWCALFGVPPETPLDPEQVMTWRIRHGNTYLTRRIVDADGIAYLLQRGTSYLARCLQSWIQAGRVLPGWELAKQGPMRLWYDAFTQWIDSGGKGPQPT